MSVRGVGALNSGPCWFSSPCFTEGACQIGGMEKLQCQRSVSQNVDLLPNTEDGDARN